VALVDETVDWSFVEPGKRVATGTLERQEVQALYVLGVVTASVAAGYSAFMVGLERHREELRRPRLFLVHSCEDPAALERALEKELQRQGRGVLRRHLN